jgi:glycosyltransferase involved in cell wall biosynthesis
MPRVSVLLAVRNGLPYLDEAIRSITEQTFKDFELIAVDDGSTDGTTDLLDRWSREDSRIIVLRQTNQGQTASLNRAIAVARGEYLARQDSDDVSEPERFARQVESLDRHPHLAVLGSGATIVDGDGKEIGTQRPPSGPDQLRDLVWKENVLVHGSVMMRRRALDQVGTYRPAFRYAKDWDLWLRMMQAGFVIDNLQDCLYRWRLNPDGAYVRDRSRQVRFAALAKVFAQERARYGVDSHDDLMAAQEDFERFAETYRCRGALYALWGELALRSLSDKAAATRYCLRALSSGYIRPRMLAMLCLSLSGIGWPGRSPLPSR